MAKKAPKRKLPAATSALASTETAIDLSYIADERMRVLAVPVEGLKLDPRNARQHDERSISGIAASLREFGIRKPVVVRRDTGVVIAGNGSIQAAQLNGWTHYPVVYVDDDDRTATSFAIADNRTAELSTWDQEQLAALLQEVDTVDDELRRVFDDLAAELPELTEAAAASAESALTGADGGKKSRASGESPTPGALPDKFQIIITCNDEAHQTELLARFKEEGFTCRALIS